MEISKMKIAFVSDAIYPYNKGGKEKRIYEISTRLAKRGHNVHVYCMKWWKEKGAHRIENGVHLHAISRYYPLYSGKRRSIKEAIMFAFACFKLIREDFDVIDVDHMPYFILFSTKVVCILKRKKLIASWNEVWGRKYWKEYLGGLGNIAYIIEKLSILMPDRIISISEHTTNKLKNDLLSKKDIITISVGVDFEKIKKICAASKKSDVIFAGRLLSHKNVDVLIKSIAVLKENSHDIKCLIIGDGSEKKNLEVLTQKLNLEKNIQFLSFFENHDDVYALMKSSKVFVLPSTREGFGIVVIEANACGIPVITINHKDNAARDLIEEWENGFICQLDEKEIAKNIMKVIKNRSKMKLACTKSAKLYDWDNLMKKLEEVYLI
jgi:glycosyltransferase involved in cell wall biosynthesis